MSKNFEIVKNEVKELLASVKLFSNEGIKETQKFDYIANFLVSKPYFVIEKWIELEKFGFNIEFGFLIDYSLGDTIRHYILISSKKIIGKGLGERIMFLFDPMEENNVVLALLQKFRVVYINPFAFNTTSSNQLMIKCNSKIEEVKSEGKALSKQRSNDDWELEWQGYLKEYEFKSSDNKEIKVQANSIQEAELKVPSDATYVNAKVIDEKAEMHQIRKIDWEIE
jgi:hypothetical protein